MLPRALFGCELWNNITKTDIAHLEATHHFCLKRIQNLPQRTRSDMVTGLLGFTSLQAYIDLQKLSFLGTLCHLKPTDVTYKLFVLRLYQQQNKCTKRNRGFIPDVVSVLDKYGLYRYLKDFITTCTFPPKRQWKQLCKSTLFAYEQTNWRARLNTNDDFFRFREIHHKLVPSNVWLTALEHPNTIESMTFLAKLCCQPKAGEIINCSSCDGSFTDELYHKVFECSNVEIYHIREHYWVSMRTQFNHDVYLLMVSNARNRQLIYMLGHIDENISRATDNNISEFMNFNSAFFKTLFSV